MADVRRIEHDDRVSPLAEQWPYVRFLGLGAWWAWIWLCYNSIEIMRMFPAEQQTSYVLQMYLFSTLGIAACMFAAAAFRVRVTEVIDRRPTAVCFGAFAALSTLLLGFSIVMGAGVFFLLAAVFTGIGTSGLCLKVGRIYGSVSLGDSLTTGAISLLLAALLYFVGIGVPPEWRLFYLAALPLVSGLLLSMGSADPFPSARSGAGEDGADRAMARHVFRKLVAASALVAVTAGVGKGIASVLVDNAAFAREGSITVFCVGAIAVVVAYVVNRGDAVRGARQVYAGLMVLGVAMMLATCFGLSVSYLSIGKESLWLVFSCFMAYLAFRFDLSPVRVFGIGQGVYFLASTAGWAAGSLIAPYYAEPVVRMAVGVVLAFIVVVVLVYVFPESDLKRIMAWGAAGGQAAAAQETAAGAGTGPMPGLPAEGGPGEPAQAGDGRAGGGIARAADPRYGLSSRELEILDLFAQGRSANWIADSLTISKNTVRSHLRAIYTKLDVHTRQELLDFLAG